MNRFRRIALYLLVLALAAGIIAYRQWNKPHTDFTELDAAAQLTVTELVQSFDHGSSPWLNQPVEVTGQIGQADENGGTLEGGVVFTWAEGITPQVLRSGDGVTLKGRLVGFDDLFGEARMDQCVLR